MERGYTDREALGIVLDAVKKYGEHGLISSLVHQVRERGKKALKEGQKDF